MFVDPPQGTDTLSWTITTVSASHSLSEYSPQLTIQRLFYPGVGGSSDHVYVFSSQ